jgi:hypothetical protein
LELERDSARFDFRGPAIVLITWFLGDIALAVQGPRQNVNAHWPGSWFETISIAAFSATVAATVSYVLQLLFRKRIGSLLFPTRVEICDNCHRVRRRGGESSCECGGTFDDFDRWTWIDAGGPEEEGDAQDV